MNTILFERHELDSESRLRLRPGDKRLEHIRNVLRAGAGDRLHAGVVDGVRGALEIEADSPDGMLFRFLPSEIGRSGAQAAGGVPISVLLGSVRPIVLKRLLRDLTSFGVDEILVARTELSERSYFGAKVWAGTRLREALIEGAAQGGHTRLPRVGRYDSLQESLRSRVRHHGEEEARIVLTSGSPPLPEAVAGSCFPRVLLAVGPERGFIDREMAMLTDFGFVPVGLPGGTLRTESAAIAGVAAVRSVIRATD